MGVLVWILIGLIAGWLASRVIGSRGGIIRYLIVGLIGSLLGGFLFRKLGVEVVPDFWGELITATIGALVLLFLWRAIRGA